MYCPVLGSRSSNVSKKGSYCRCSGRAIVQKRLLSVNPAEPKTMRWTWASARRVEVAPSVAVSATRHTSTVYCHCPCRVLRTAVARPVGPGSRRAPHRVAWTVGALPRRCRRIEGTHIDEASFPSVELFIMHLPWFRLLRVRQGEGTPCPQKIVRGAWRF